MIPFRCAASGLVQEREILYGVIAVTIRLYGLPDGAACRDRTTVILRVV